MEALRRVQPEPVWPAERPMAMNAMEDCLPIPPEYFVIMQVVLAHDLCKR